MVESILQVGSVKGTDAKGTGTGTGGAWTVLFLFGDVGCGCISRLRDSAGERAKNMHAARWKPAILGAFGLFCLLKCYSLFLYNTALLEEKTDLPR